MEALTAHSLFGVIQVIIHGRHVLWRQDEPGQQKKKQKKQIFIIIIIFVNNKKIQHILKQYLYIWVMNNNNC